MHRTLECLNPMERLKNPLHPDIPYHYLHEQERGLNGNLEDVNTIFLTSKQCSFDCVMCDLWKNTLDGPTPPGAMLKQIDHALARLPRADVIKLYNSGNFFDTKAVPPDEYDGIARRIAAYDRVIVENHPKLCGSNCVAFKNRLRGTLEVAMGLETIHPVALPALQKQMTPEDFARAANFLVSNGIDVRAFILISPPHLIDPHESVAWTLKTVQFAFQHGVNVCTIIATRPGTAKMKDAFRQGRYAPPTFDMLEDAFQQALALKRGRVFADTWDLGFLTSCSDCLEARVKRLEWMNRQQQAFPNAWDPAICKCQEDKHL